ncbi:MAG: hypothetical protein ACKO7U_04105, partial [Actinomycetota bacterium]
VAPAVAVAVPVLETVVAAPADAASTSSRAIDPARPGAIQDRAKQDRGRAAARTPERGEGTGSRLARMCCPEW